MNAPATIRSAVGRLPALILAIGTPSLALAALVADNEPRNVLMSGEFEHGSISLRLPAVSPFPLVVGGWGARLDEGGVEIVRETAGVDRRVLQIDGRSGSSAHVIQDVPLGSRAFVFAVAVQRHRGRQTIALLPDWDRLDPETDSGVRLEMRASTLRIRTPSDAWRVGMTMTDREWVHLGLVADPRTGLLEIHVDGAPVAAFPAIPSSPVRTIVIGASGDGVSRFRYDAATLFRLGEIELAELRRQVLRHVPEAEVDYLMRRLDDAARAMGNGADVLAGAELRATARLLRRLSVAADATPELDALGDSADRLAALSLASMSE